jgi:hypothetical protein
MSDERVLMTASSAPRGLGQNDPIGPWQAVLSRRYTILSRRYTMRGSHELAQP